MGREYFGDIGGKLAFGIQNSDDIENLVTINFQEQFCFHYCECIAENTDKTYCDDCFDSYEEHLETAKEECCLENDDNILIKLDNVIIYKIEKEKHFIELKKNMDEIMDLLPSSVIDEFNKIKSNEEIIDGYSNIFSNVCSEMNKYIEKDVLYFHRYKLGVQIQYILNKQDTCMVCCEVY
jgi:hypothetical protein